MCIFCKIIEGEIPSKTIYEDDIVKCFLDLDQTDLGHTLIIPKEHTLDITTIPINNPIIMAHIIYAGMNSPFPTINAATIQG